MRGRRVRAVAVALALPFAAALPVRDASAGIAAPAPGPDPRAAVAAAERLIATRPEVIHRSPKDRFVRRDVIAGMAGLQYVSYERTYAGSAGPPLPVLGGDFVVVTDAAGRVLSTSVNQRTDLAVGTRPTISPGEAAEAAKSSFTTASGTTRTSKPRLVVLARGTGRLAYKTMVTGTARTRPSTLHVLTDAGTGATIETWDDLHEAAAATPARGDARTHFNGPRVLDTTYDDTQYGLSDPLRPGLRCGGQDGATYTNATNTWGDGSGGDLVTACTDAMFAAAREWDMMRAWLSRRGFDGHGRGFPMRVGWEETDGQWSSSGKFARFGHFGAVQYTPMDMIGHELGHSVFQFTPGGSDGDDAKQSLNESTADIFGTLTEWYAQEPGNAEADGPDYTIFERVNLSRYMYQPSLLDRGGEQGRDPDCNDQVREGMDVHAVAGVQNHWFYLLAEGSHANDPAHGRPDSPTCNDRPVDGLGIRKAGAIYMEMLNRKTSHWNIHTARLISLRVAVEAFPNSCVEFTTVRAAWEAVNVHSVDGEPSECPSQ